MRSWLTVLLWVLLPLQLSWAAVGGWDAGRCAPAVLHASHGACPCPPTATPAREAAEASGLLAHLACESCHGQSHLAGPSPPATGPLPTATVFAEVAATAHPSPPPARPERPRWHTLA